MSYWYCPNCKIELDGCHVTYEELCEYCGTAVLSVKESIYQEELDELIQAKAEGRLVVLPVKVGDAVYEPRKDRGIISEYEITEIIINQYGVSFFRWNLKEGIYSHLGGFPVECLGKTVFLTREEAEKAIGGKEDV